MCSHSAKCLSLSHLTLYVSNARQTAINFCLQYGFRPYRYRGLESGHRLRTSHAVINNNIVMVFVSPLSNCEHNKHMNEHIVRHGDSVKDVAFNVNSVGEYLNRIKSIGGVCPLLDEWCDSDHRGDVKYATVAAFGDITHTLIERNGYPMELFLPGWKRSPLKWLRASVEKLPLINLLSIDHVAANQTIGSMADTIQWYENTLGFHRYWSQDDTQTDTELSGMKTAFIANNDETIRIPIAEPVIGPKKSQIQEFLDYNDGPGIQHIALNTNDICDTVYRLRERGVEFISTPDEYYERLIDRLRHSGIKIREQISLLKRLNILVDFNSKGYLLQIFTKPLQDRPTLFMEIIQRHNYNGFGAGNIKALFEAIEAQQSLRGNL